MPKVSVVIPTYNRPELIQRALRSVISQSFQDFEIIVVDDGQERTAANTVELYNDERIKYIKNKKSLGGGGARNIGIQVATGKYIAFLDDDDEWDKSKLQLQVDALEKSDDSVVMVFTGVEMRDEQGEVFRRVLPKEEGEVTPYERLLHRPYIWTSSIMMRTTVRDAGGYFDETLPKNQEWDLTVRLSKDNIFYAINEPLAHLNVLGENEHMGGKGNMKNIIKGNELFLTKHKSVYSKRPRSHAAQLFRLAGFYYEYHDYINMRENLFRSWKLQPFNMVYFKHFMVSLCGGRVYAFFRK